MPRFVETPHEGCVPDLRLREQPQDRLDALYELILKRELEPERHGCQDQLRSQRNVSVRCESRIERRAHVIDGGAVPAHPLGSAHRFPLDCGGLQQIDMMLGVPTRYVR